MGGEERLPEIERVPLAVGGLHVLEVDVVLRNEKAGPLLELAMMGIKSEQPPCRHTLRRPRVEMVADNGHDHKTGRHAQYRAALVESDTGYEREL